jgi:hypothetical protein
MTCPAGPPARPPRSRSLRHVADHYTHVDDEMITDMLASLTQRLQSAVIARAQIDQVRGANRAPPSRFWTRGWARSGPGERVLYQMALPDCAPICAPTVSAEPTRLTSPNTLITSPTARVRRKRAPICALTTGNQATQDDCQTLSKLGKRFQPRPQNTRLSRQCSPL